MSKARLRAFSLVVILIAVCCSDSAVYAKTVDLGFLVGANYSSVQASTVSFFTPSISTTGAASGLSYGGGVSATFFQENWIGVALNADAASIDASTSPYSYSAKLLMASGTVNFNFNLWSKRHSLGIGAGQGYLNGASQSLGGGTLPSQSTVFVIEGKDLWGPANEPHFFITARGFIMNNVFSTASTLLLGIGYEF